MNPAGRTNHQRFRPNSFASRQLQTQKTQIDSRTSAENPPAAPFATSPARKAGISSPFAAKNCQRTAKGPPSRSPQRRHKTCACQFSFSGKTSRARMSTRKAGMALGDLGHRTIRAWCSAAPCAAPGPTGAGPFANGPRRAGVHPLRLSLRFSGTLSMPPPTASPKHPTADRGFPAPLHASEHFHAPPFHARPSRALTAATSPQSPRKPP